MLVGGLAVVIHTTGSWWRSEDSGDHELTYPRRAYAQARQLGGTRSSDIDELLAGAKPARPTAHLARSELQQKKVMSTS